MSEHKSRFYVYLGRWDLRVPKFLWLVLPLAGHIEGGRTQ